MRRDSRASVSIDDARVELQIDGRWMGSVNDEALAWVLLDMYVGDDVVIPELRAQVADWLSRVLDNGRRKTESDGLDEF